MPTSATVPTPVATPIATPVATPDPLQVTLVSPAEGASFSNIPRSLQLIWSTAPQAVKYRVELEFGFGSPLIWAAIPTNSGYYGDCNDWMTTTSCVTLTFPGAQPGRWRVISISATQLDRASPWRGFTFTR